MKTMTPALSSAGLLSLIFHLLASVEISYAFTISTQKISSQPFFFKKSSSGSSRLEYRVLQPLALSKQDEDDEMRIEDQSASSLTDKTSTNGETETNGAKILNDSSPERQEMKEQKQVQTKTKKPTAVATSLKDDDEQDTVFDNQKQELESKYNIELNRLKLTLAATREELNQVEGRAKAFEETSKSLQKELSLEIEGKKAALALLQKEIDEKYKAQVDAIKADQIAHAEKMEDEVANLESTIEELRSELGIARMKAAELEETTEMLEKRIATEIEAKRTALLELERSLTEKFEEEADVLKEENDNKAKELEQFKKESEELLLELQTENRIQREAMESQVCTLTDDIEIVTAQLKDARKYSGKMRREINFIKRSAIFELSSLRRSHKKEIIDMEISYVEDMEKLKENARLEKESIAKNIDGLKAKLDVEKAMNIRLRKDMEALSKDFLEQLEKSQEKAEKDIEELNESWIEKIEGVVEKSANEEEELTHERNMAVAERDFIIQGYEQDLSSLKSMAKRTLQIIKARIKKRYKKLEEKFVIMKKVRVKMVKVAKQSKTFLKSQTKK